MRYTSCLTILITLSALLGCPEEPQIRSYETAKPELGFIVQSGLMYRPPAQWKAMPAGNMVMASYDIEGGARMTISAALGTLTDNINRWRQGQLRIPPVEGEVDPKSLEKIESEAGDILIVDLHGDPENPDNKNARRFRIGLVPEKRDGKLTGRTIFFKLDGTSALIERERERFDTMLAGLRFSEENKVSDSDDEQYGG